MEDFHPGSITQTASEFNVSRDTVYRLGMRWKNVFTNPLVPESVNIRKHDLDMKTRAISKLQRRAKACSIGIKLLGELQK